MSAWGPAVTAVDVFRDQLGRPYAAGWRFDPASPWEVQLHLTGGDGVTRVWRFARELLAPDAVGPAGGDVALIASRQRLVVQLYPLTLRAKSFTGSLAVALDFLVATEAAVPRCSGCESPDCVSCGTARTELAALLAGITREATP